MDSLSTPTTALLSRHSSSRAFFSNVEGIRRISSVCPSASYTFPSRISCQHATSPFSFSRKYLGGITSKRLSFMIPRSTGSSQSGGEGSKDSSATKEKVPFGYTRKDVLLIGLGVTVIGVGLKSGLEYAGFDPLQAGNVVQLVIVLGLTVGWISTYMFRVSNKEMTYVQQLRDYENKVMEKRLEGLTEAELQTLLAQVEEEKQRQPSSEQVN